MDLALLIEDDRWGELGVETLARTAARATAEHLGLDADTLEISVLACNDARIAGLNTEFRDKPVPTNVLSWPAEDLSAQVAGALPRAPSADFEGVAELGDIAIAYETCARESVELGKPMADHVMHLLVHALLHLLGYDHIRDPDAAVMQEIEREILGKMGLDDPYRE